MVGFVAVVAAPAGSALAVAPSPTIASPLNGSITNNPTPFFSGFAEEANGEVSLTIREGRGKVIQEPLETPASPLGGTWSLGPAEHLSDGTYTATATQVVGKTILKSLPVTFTVDTAPPGVKLSVVASPTSSTPSFSGEAGVATGDIALVRLKIFLGTAAVGSPVRTLEVAPSGASWTIGPVEALQGGTYTAQAEQSDRAGNTGMSASVTFTVTPPETPPATSPETSPPAPPPPTASFSWFPSVPETGQNVSLVSTSTDSTSPITAFAWALTGNGAFAAGGPLMTTSFSTPGGHVVRLNVTDANGRSSVATETIPVASIPLILMQPFPIVRIAGSETSSGVRLRLLTAQAPFGARVTVSCRGRGCPAKSEGQVAASSKSKAGTVVVEFRRFERSLRAGVVLEIRISKSGEIGKYTRFVVRRGKLPERADMCLDATGVSPLVCPSS
jgi:hypothetical protein